MVNGTSVNTLQRVFTASKRKHVSSQHTNRNESIQPRDNGPTTGGTDSSRNGSGRQSMGIRVGRRQDLQKGTKLLNDVADSLNRDIEFEVTGPDGLVQARIKNSDTGEEIRAIPPDEVILVQKKIDAFLGLFFDQQG